MVSRAFSSIFLVLVLTSCAGVSIISKSDLYSEQFLATIEEVTQTFRAGNKTKALGQLESLNDEFLEPSEIAMKYNLKGVIVFSSNKLSESVEAFDEALKNSMLDKELNAKINLNLASVHYRAERLMLALTYALDVKAELLNEKDREKTYRLRFILGQQLDRPDVVLRSVIYLERKVSHLDDIRDSRFKNVLVENFAKLEESQRANLLSEMQDVAPLLVAFLAREEVYKRYYSGDRSGAEGILYWMKRNFYHFEFVPPFIESFSRAIDNYGKIDLAAIGVVLPLSDERKVYGRRALKGIDLALDRISTKSELGTPYMLHIEDNHNSPDVAKLKVRKLIENNNVAFIIGGLFSSTAKYEYLEAKKYGVLFISLSPVYLPRQQKDHLLIEISGSTESQVSALMQEKALEVLGKKVAVLYPRSDRGESYIEELWRHYDQGKIDLKGVYHYKEDSTDLRDPVKNLLGLKYPRERDEEKKIWKEIYDMQGRGSVRRVQTLPPQTDFDWVYLIAYPHVTQQIIPAFKYFDANRAIFVGGPSWKSKSLIERQRSLAPLYLVSDDPDLSKRGFISGYNQRFGGSPQLIETLAYESMSVGLDVLSNKDIKSRDSLNSNLLSRQNIAGLTGLWQLTDGIWLKQLSLLNISKGSIQKVY